MACFLFILLQIKVELSIEFASYKLLIHTPKRACVSESGRHRTEKKLKRVNFSRLVHFKSLAVGYREKNTKMYNCPNTWTRDEQGLITFISK